MTCMICINCTNCLFEISISGITSTPGFFIFIGILSFVAVLGLFGLAYLCKYQCLCCCRKELEKTDVNQIYGEYYYSDGREMATEMEVIFKIVQIDGIKKRRRKKSR